MYIFYDFETSSKELLGQILSYSFIVTDSSYNITDELTGEIKLNRTQLPEPEAILINRINVLELQKKGEPENIAAKKIFDFLLKQVDIYMYCTLVGFNCNSFDISFLRNLLIRYGVNPYFEGKLANLDVLHFAQYLAFEHPDKYIWSLAENKEKKPYYSFKLETIAQAFDVINSKQTHSARDDVLLLINLVIHLQKEFNLSLTDFRPVKLTLDFFKTASIAKQKTLDYSNTDQSEPKKYIYKYWLNLVNSNKFNIVLNLNSYKDLLAGSDSPDKKELLSCIRYINHNKHFFVLEPLDNSEKQEWDNLLNKSAKNPFLSSLTPEDYFQLIKKDWDIEYQIHELGFNRIPRLYKIINTLLHDPNSYSTIIADLVKSRKDKKDNYLIQLFNRVYLNYHPNPKPEHLQKYIQPRYITGTMLRNPENFSSLEDSFNLINNILDSEDYTTEDKTLLMSLKEYYHKFCKKYL